jgi:CRISPR-associated protein Cmr1
MYVLNLTVENITPIFMYGSDGITPELRPSEFKGMMRFWWRAIRACDDIDELRKEEAEIFGGSGEEEGRSKIILRVKPQPENDNIGYNFSNVIEYNSNRQNRILNNKGIAYLLYSALKKNYIKENFNFQFEIQSYDENAFKNAVASLWLSINLGGFGLRSRRGAGNIIVNSIAKGDTCELEFVANTNNEDPKEFVKYLRNNIDKCSKIINGQKIKNFSSTYSNLSFSRIIISNKTFGNYKEALNDIGEKYANFRSENKYKIFDMAAFGMPIIHSNGKKIVSKSSERRNSPIIIKLIKINDKYKWMVLRLSGELIKENNVVTLKEKIKKEGKTNWEIKDSRKVYFNIIDELWNKLKSENNEEFILTKPEILDKIVDSIKKEINPDKIILFGSRARGDGHKNSDIDIAVEKPKKPLSTLQINASYDIVDLGKINMNFKNKISMEGINL